MKLTPKLMIALMTTVIAFSSLYIPQPLLPQLAIEFGISASEAGLLMTVCMLPLALAPVFYGYFLQAIPARTMLMVALLLLSINQLCFYFVEDFWQLLGLRLIQGLLLPAIFTALMTYCATMVPPKQVRAAMGFYIGSSILGGFSGRLLGGLFATNFDWRMAFVVVGLLQLVPLVLISRIETKTAINFSRLDRASIGRVLKHKNYRFLFLALASVFFVFSGVLNIVPFHLQTIDNGVTPVIISLLYLGYLAGVPVSFFSQLIARKMKSDRRGLQLGLLVHGIGLIALLWVGFYGLIVAMFWLAAGFFLIHSLLSGLANQLTKEHKGVVNGLYVSIYYFSGALGSWLPGFLYDGLGWNGMILIFIVILSIGAWSLSRFRSGLSSD